MAHTEERHQVPNHHGDHPGFSGITGLLAGLTMVLGREGDARLAARLTGLGPGDRIVDIGSGPGVAVRYAARQGVDASGVEPASVMRSLAHRLTRSSTPVSYVDGVAEALPLPDNHATVAWSIITVHHWPDLDAGLAEVRRVLAPGGRFVALERRTRPGAKGLASHGWTDEQVEAFAVACREHGFDDVHVGRHTVGRRRQVLAVVATEPPAADA